MRPGDTFRATFSISGTPTGSVTAILLRNLAEDTTVGTSGVLACSQVGSTNLYTTSVVLPAGYVAGDTVELAATCTISGVTQSFVGARAVIAPAEIGTTYGTVVSGTPALFVVSGLVPDIAKGQHISRLATVNGVLTLTGPARTLGLVSFDVNLNQYTFGLTGTDEAGPFASVAAGDKVWITP